MYIHTHINTETLSIFILLFSKNKIWKERLQNLISDILWDFKFILYVSPVFSRVRITTFITKKKKKNHYFHFFKKSKIITDIRCDSSLPNFLPHLIHKNGPN